MKSRAFLLVAFLVLPFVVGCSTQGLTPTSPPAQVNTAVSQSSAQIQAATTLATRLALLAIPEAERSAAAAEIHSISSAVAQVTDTQQPDVAGFENLVTSTLSKSQSKYAEVAASILTGTVGLVNAELQGQYANLSANQKAQTTLALIRAVSAGVSDATAAPFTLPHHVPHPVEHSAITEPNGMVTSPFNYLCFA